MTNNTSESSVLKALRFRTSISRNSIVPSKSATVSGDWMDRPAYLSKPWNTILMEKHVKSAPISYLTDRDRIFSNSIFISLSLSLLLTSLLYEALIFQLHGNFLHRSIKVSISKNNWTSRSWRNIFGKFEIKTHVLATKGMFQSLQEKNGQRFARARLDTT